ncbi:MAG: antitoxin [Actinomycetota bacterium]
MGFMDKIKEMFGQNKGRVEGGIDKVGDTVDDKTSGKYADKVDLGQEKAKDMLNKDDGTV